MRVLIATNMYPFAGAPYFGIFVQQQVESLRSWVYGVARRTMSTYRRSRRSRNASGAEYAEVAGRIVKQQKKAATRGLNRNHHPRLKAIFKGAALSVLRDQNWRAYYDGLVADGTKPELARISVARKLAAITLAVWQRREEYDPKKVFATA